YAAKDILAAAGVNSSGINVVSCPTCGRTKVCLEKVAAEVCEAVKTLKTDKKLTVAVMGCIVNGPGEAREADVGLAGGTDEFLLFVKGEPRRKVSADSAVAALVSELSQML
ncbi:MAG: flavodoxin-dependent (E)-4-hydroxy-3-methylbut-2-enyl-diphosphate synthase, partial [Oscillospiraceae bacterium]|nr:flavodoxin-dependent (E)-4-hydroxy-3-methylbut-2-enyl-diphosphate synthase [Oscillospiraceae bacterium]